MNKESLGKAHIKNLDFNFESPQTFRLETFSSGFMNGVNRLIPEIDTIIYKHIIVITIRGLAVGKKQ